MKLSSPKFKSPFFFLSDIWDFVSAEFPRPVAKNEKVRHQVLKDALPEKKKCSKMPAQRRKRLKPIQSVWISRWKFFLCFYSLSTCARKSLHMTKPSAFSWKTSRARDGYILEKDEQHVVEYTRTK